MLSNIGDADTRLECFEMGAADYLVKGLSLSDLRARVGGLLADQGRIALDREPEPMDRSPPRDLPGRPDDPPEVPPSSESTPCPTTTRNSLDYLYGRLNYERLGMPKGSAELRLGRMRRLLRRLGDPHEALRRSSTSPEPRGRVRPRRCSPRR